MTDVLQGHVAATLRTSNGDSFGDWQTITGGRITSEAAETRDVGANYSRKIPGPKTIESITLTRDYQSPRDDVAYASLEALAGTPAKFIIGKITRDGAGNVIGTKTRTGILLEVMDNEGNTNGGTDKATLEVVIGING